MRTWHHSKTNTLIKKWLQKIESISYLELIILFFISAITIGSIKFFGYQGQVWQTVEIQLTTKIWQDNYNPLIDLTVPRWLVENVNLGDVEYAANGEIIAKVIDSKVYERDRDTVIAFLTVSLKGLTNKRTHEFLYKNQSVSVGSNITLKINNHNLPGQILSINEPNSGMLIPANATLRIQSVEPWIIKAINDQMPIEIKELKSNQTITTLKSSSLAAPITNMFMDYNYLRQKQPIIFNSSEVKDIIINSTLMIENRNGQWYFAHNKPLKIGSSITLSTPNIGLINAEIQSIDLPPSK